MPKGCTPENVEGKLVGLSVSSENHPPFNEIDDMTPSATAAMQETVNLSAADQFDAIDPGQNAGLVEALNWPESTGNAVKNILNDVRNPSGILGESYIKPVHDFLVKHLQEFGENVTGEVARKSYDKQIRGVLASLPQLSEDHPLHGYAERYRRFYLNYSEFYSKQGGTATTKAVSNLAGNVLQNSPTVVLGNIAEGMIKLPTLYPGAVLPAIRKALEATGGNLLNKVPELEAKGVYGSSLGLERGVFGSRFAGGVLKDGIIGLTDNPLKTIAYYAGELAHGDGLKGVQDVAFVPRLGDLPSVYYNNGSRMMVQFLGYSINTYKMYGQMWKDLINPETAGQAAQRLITYHALAGVIGGAGAALPEPAVQMITAVFPESEEWFDENRTPFAGLIQPASIDRIGITASIASQKIKMIGQGTTGALGAIGDQDYAQMVISGSDAIMGAASFGTTPLGDAQLQKAIRMGRDAWLDDEEPDFSKFLPFVQ